MKLRPLLKRAIARSGTPFPRPVAPPEDPVATHRKRGDRERHPALSRWQSYLRDGDRADVAADGIQQVGPTKFAVDRIMLFAHQYFFVEGWVLGPHANALTFAVEIRGIDCEFLVFRRDRFDVNDGFQLPRAFPNDRAGFRIFGRLTSAAGEEDLLLGVLLGEREGSLEEAGAVRQLCIAPTVAQSCDAGDIWRPLLESIRHHFASSAADLVAAIALLNRVRARDVALRASLAFPANGGQAVDVVILARTRPELAAMNASLIQRALPPNARIFVVAVTREASLRVSELIASLPRMPGVSLQYLVTHVTLPSSFVVSTFLDSDHAPSVALILDDVFIGPGLGEIAAAINTRQSIAVPRSELPGLSPTLPTPRLQTANGRMVGSLGQEVLSRAITPFGAVVLHERTCDQTLPLQYYQGRGLVLEEIYRKHASDMLIAEAGCLDPEMDDHISERYFFNRVLLAHAVAERAPPTVRPITRRER